MKSQIKFSQFAVLMLLVACNNSQKLNYSIKTIDLESNIGNFREISLSQINAEINYLPLLNNEKTGIDRIISMDVSSDFILVNDYKQCLLYDKSGKQIAKIYEKDRSENEKGIIMGSSFGPQNTIYIQSSNGFLEFDHNGKYLKTIDFNKEKDPNFYFSSWTPVNDSLIFIQIPNSSGHEINKAIIFNSNGESIYKYKNHIILNRLKRMFSTEDAVASFNMYNGKVYFKELYNDTLFYLTNSFSLLPELAFKLGKYSEPDSFRENLPPPTGNLSGYVNVRNVFQSASFLMIDCYFAHNIPAPEKNIKQKQWYEEGKPWYNTTRVLGLYNKANDSLLFSKLTSTANTLFTTGLYNDIDAGPRFYPFKQVNDSTFVMGINANLFKGHIASEDFKNNNPKYPDKKKSLEQFGSKLADFDELILMYVTIK